MPIQASIGAGVLGASAVKDAIYVTIIANGLKGLMSVKPYCTNSNSLCDKADNGKWILSGKRIKTYNQIGDLDQGELAWSDITDQQVTLTNIENFWNYRNTLTPVVAGLLKVLKDQTQSINDGDSNNDINAYSLLVDLLIPLIKVYIFYGPDPYQKSLTNDDVNITLFRT